MPKPRGKYNDIIKSKDLTIQFTEDYEELSVAELMVKYGINRDSYAMLQKLLELEPKTARDRVREGIAKFYSWEPLDPTVMDFSIIMNWGERRR